MATAYSAIDSGTPRAREVSAYPDGDVPGKGDAFNRRWRDLRAYAALIADGDVTDPCPGADHWNARNLAPERDRAEKAIREGRRRLVRCREHTANMFTATTARAPRIRAFAKNAQTTMKTTATILKGRTRRSLIKSNGSE